MSTPTPGPSRRPAPRPSRDQVLAAGVVARLLLDERTRGEPIAVQVQNRVAILTGRAHHPDAAHAAAYLAWRTPGITDVCNAIDPAF